MPGQSTHVAQLNIGLLNYPQDDPRTAGFTDNVAKVNAIAERSKGFVWRCVDEDAALKAEGIALFDGNPCALCTMSVWETANDLETFVHRTAHGAFLKRRAEWFRPLGQKTYVVWPVPAGHVPTFGEGLERLDRLMANGSTQAAYDFSHLRAAAQRGAK